LKLPILSVLEQEGQNLLFLQTHEHCPRQRAIAAHLDADPQANPSVTMKMQGLLDAFSLSLSDKSIFREFETLEKEYGSTSIISLEDAVNFLSRVSHPTGAEQINDLGRLIRFVNWFN
jgi:hypothetical protein